MKGRVKRLKVSNLKLCSYLRLQVGWNQRSSGVQRKRDFRYSRRVRHSHAIAEVSLPLFWLFRAIEARILGITELNLPLGSISCCQQADNGSEASRKSFASCGWRSCSPHNLISILQAAGSAESKEGHLLLLTINKCSASYGGGQPHSGSHSASYRPFPERTNPRSLCRPARP
ncbi:MAG: hypothetical protein K0Q94_3765 [Paenibacillus sp.]|jgi:hypothetical protein|nr:hypothetical protein [Paenibacillus sp.]